MGIKENVGKILSEIPEYVTLVAAAKTRTAEEILESLEAGIRVIGENYVQEAESVLPAIKGKCSLHMIGHLQRNKVKKAVELFDMIQTVDSLKLAMEIDKRAGALGKVMPVLIEINSGREPQKNGIMPENLFDLLESISDLKNIAVKGLMTMGPILESPEDLKPYFRLTRKLFEDASKKYNSSNIEMKWLSMGMSDSYLIAIAEGANMVRIGSKIFGPRYPYKQ
ncbi:alanine racemase [Kosmotoga arenicorallina S304]|uniref:Pyridoxal phosphate homeostasis protein n=1 Tax=Kosmotoga arenicorallina S304 TaxID=1453497 RepID=A0A176JWD6_9BACT|nr:YggS family pyridoxal phosphate-dependent enzyme [Kosmotoga arenicorallina]OAA27994.1 alanine racemase [Kosmotoga arenicorallina S304]